VARVGIVTFHYALNSGAVLQAYGLAKAIEQMGHDVHVIDYCSRGARRAYYPRGFRHWGFRSHGGPIAAFIRRRRFRQFREKHLPLSLRTYLNNEDFAFHPPDVDCLVCGSDQVWNIRTASCGGFDPVFFLASPLETRARRISYGACFGPGELGDYQETIRTLISRFDHLSVRDLRSQDIVRKLVGREAVHVLDPSFLVDYDPITPEPVLHEPYVLVYCMERNPFFERAVALLHRLSGWRVISVNTGFSDAGVASTAGPLEWLSLVRHAAFVCTNSFHGTCFSLIWQKRFATLPIGGGMQFRLDDLLQTAGLQDRLVRSEDELAAALDGKVDYEGAAPRLHQAYQRSIGFLREALG